LGHQDSYAQKLQAEYDHYAKMLGLIPMKPANWRFMRMRPPEFPTRRIAQLAGWIEYGDTRFSTYLNESHFSKIIGKMKFKASDYWVDHVRFGRDTKPMTTEVGNATLSKIVANAILPMFCLYGEITGMPEPKERALLFASEMKAEKNRITRLWKNAPLSVDSLLDSQAVIQLTKEYCRKRRCLECAIGSAILCGHNQNKANADS
jgi:hypothetical protein